VTICNSCGKENTSEGKFCVYCGRLLDGGKSQRSSHISQASSGSIQISSEMSVPSQAEGGLSVIAERRWMGGYRLLSFLGEGGMGRVYRVRQMAKDDPSLNSFSSELPPICEKDLALKVLTSFREGDRRAKKRFFREGKVLEAIQHPNIVTFHEMFEDAGRFAIVMELLEGETLEQRLRRGPIPFLEALDLAEELLEALDAAHQAGAIHRDLKPSNIFLCKHNEVQPTGELTTPPKKPKPRPPQQGTVEFRREPLDTPSESRPDEPIANEISEELFRQEASEADFFQRGSLQSGLPILKAKRNYQIKIMDFGLARFLDGSMATTIGNRYEEPGTLPYMAPEQLRRNVPLDERTDLYALGVILYEVFTGERLVPLRSTRQMIRKVLEGRPPKLPSDIKSYFPPQIENWLRHLLNKDIEKRPGSAGEALQTLRDARSLQLETPREESVASSWTWFALFLLLFLGVGASLGYLYPNKRGKLYAFSIRWIATLSDTMENWAAEPTLQAKKKQMVVRSKHSLPIKRMPNGIPDHTSKDNSLEPQRPKVKRFRPYEQGPPDDLRKMVKIPKGWFRMGGVGSHTKIAWKRLSTFWIDRREVTNRDYRKCIKAKKCKPLPKFLPSRYKGAYQPVVAVDWFEAFTYCRFRKKRLPSSAEWEKAARGTKARLFPPHKNRLSCRLANYGKPRHGKAECPKNPGKPVSTLQYTRDKSPYGIWHMAGNVREWTGSCYSKQKTCTQREVRGGGWRSFGSALLASRRHAYFSDARAFDLGFRCVWP